MTLHLNAKLLATGTAVAVVAMIVLLLVSDDYARRRSKFQQQGLEQAVEALLAQDRDHALRTLKLERSIDDDHSLILKRLVRSGNEAQARELAKQWLVTYYARKLNNIKETGPLIDRQLARLAQAGYSTEQLEAEFKKRLLDPVSRAESELAKAQATTPAQALQIVLVYFEQLYEWRTRRIVTLEKQAYPGS